MAIFSLNEELQGSIVEKEDQSIVPMYQSDRIDEEVKGLISGFRWEVTYFHRQVNEGTLITQYDPNLDITLQDYIRINKLIINLESGLPPGIPDDLGGTGYIDLDTIPTPNDLFLAKLPDGTSVIYVITEVVRINYTNENVFKITFRAAVQVDSTDDPFLAKQLASTSETLYYNRDYKLTHTKPLYTEEEYVDRKMFMKYLDRLINFWDSKFVTPKTNYYIGYPKQPRGFIVDIQMQDFIRDIVGINNLNQKVETLDIIDKNISILDAIVKDNIIVDRINMFTKHIDPMSFGSNPYLFSIYTTGVDDIITCDNIDNKLEEVENNVNKYYPKVNERCYIFKEIVYDIVMGYEYDNDKYEELTLFEKVFLTMMSGNVIDKEDINKLYIEIYSLNDRELFYFLPILMYIIKYYIITFTIEFI